MEIRIESEKTHSECSTEGMETKKLVASPMHLQDILDNHSDLDATSEKTIDLIYKGALWLSFSGITVEQAVKMTSADIDIKRRIALTDIKAHHLYNESIDVLGLLCKMNAFTYNHPLYKTKRKRYDGEEILRGFVKITPYYFMQNLSFHFNEHKEYWLTYNSVYMSGMFYRTYQKECIDGCIDLTELISTDLIRRKLTDKTVNVDPIRRYTLQRYRFYLKEYQKWKDIFKL